MGLLYQKIRRQGYMAAPPHNFSNRKADKQQKGKLLDEFIRQTGYTRKYALHLLTRWGKETFLMADGKPVKLKAGSAIRRRGAGGNRSADRGQLPPCGLFGRSSGTLMAGAFRLYRGCLHGTGEGLPYFFRVSAFTVIIGRQDKHPHYPRDST
jgi:hypothetical protein